MQYVYILLIFAITFVLLLFVFQNLASVTVSFFSSSLTLPLSVLMLGVYILGMLTGGFVVALLRTLVHGATRKPKQE